MGDVLNFDFTRDTNKYIRMGFTLDEIESTVALMQNGFKITNNSLMQLGYNCNTCGRMIHLKNLIEGKEVIENEDELIKHLKKLSKGQQKLDITDLDVSSVREVPRTAVILGIKEAPFDIWNSNRYSGREMLYVVRDITPTDIIIETGRKPTLRRDEVTKIDNVIEIIGATTQGKAVIKVDKKYCKLCNRFIIVASLKRPEVHHGMFIMISRGGTKVYVYATTLKAKDKMRYNQGSQRVYDFGFLPNEISDKLKRASLRVYEKVHGVKIDVEQATSRFNIVNME